MVRIAQRVDARARAIQKTVRARIRAGPERAHRAGSAGLPAGAAVIGIARQIDAGTVAGRTVAAGAVTLFAGLVRATRHAAGATMARVALRIDAALPALLLSARAGAAAALAALAVGAARLAAAAVIGIRARIHAAAIALDEPARALRHARSARAHLAGGARARAVAAMLGILIELDAAPVTSRRARRALAAAVDARAAIVTRRAAAAAVVGIARHVRAEVPAGGPANGACAKAHRAFCAPQAGRIAAAAVERIRKRIDAAEPALDEAVRTGRNALALFTERCRKRAAASALAAVIGIARERTTGSVTKVRARRAGTLTLGAAAPCGARKPAGAAIPRIRVAENAAFGAYQLFRQRALALAAIAALSGAARREARAAMRWVRVEGRARHAARCVGFLAARRAASLRAIAVVGADLVAAAAMLAIVFEIDAFAAAQSLRTTRGASRPGDASTCSARDAAAALTGAARAAARSAARASGGRSAAAARTSAS